MTDNDEYGVCPFNSDHHIVLYRMPRHIVKCRKSYKGPPLETCIYNACHLVPVGTMKEHLETCRDRHRFHEDKYVQIAAQHVRH